MKPGLGVIATEQVCPHWTGSHSAPPGAQGQGCLKVLGENNHQQSLQG